MTELIGIIGDRGAGKTCLMTALLYIDYANGHKIVANYHLNFPSKYMTFEQVADLPPNIKNATLGFDELGIGADSREFFKKRNSGIGKLITQIRKRNCLLYYTVQRLNLIDKRVRQQTDKFILMEKTSTPGISILRLLEGWNAEMIAKTTFDGRRFFDMYDTNEIIDTYEEDKEND